MALAFRSGLHTKAQSDQQYSSTREKETKAIKELFPSPPTSESDAAVSSPTRTLEIPDPAIFAALENKHNNTDSHDPLLPSPAECAVHLELLEAFQILQQKVLTSNALDRVLGIVPKDTIITVKGKRTRRPDPKFAQKRKVKWEIYLRFASARFLEWWTRLDEMLLATARAKGELGIVKESLPPLDVLIIWHAILQNSKAYREFCHASNVPQRLDLDFPWSAIHKALSPSTTTFLASTPAVELFTAHIGIFDLFNGLTNTHRHDPAFSATLNSLPQLLDTSTATSTNSTSTTTPSKPIAQDKPNTKTKRDAKEVDTTERATRYDPDLDAICSRKSHLLLNPTTTTTPTFLRAGASTFEPGIGAGAETQTEVVTASALVTMALYHHPYPLLAQGQEADRFPARMANIFWLRSPGLQGTMERAGARYRQFLGLFRDLELDPDSEDGGSDDGDAAATITANSNNPNAAKQSESSHQRQLPLLTPTMDIDLAWRTHLCSPARYAASCCRMSAGRDLIPHPHAGKDFEKGVLKEGFLAARILFEGRYGEEYNPCLCWECEALRGAVLGEGGKGLGETSGGDDVEVGLGGGGGSRKKVGKRGEEDAEVDFDKVAKQALWRVKYYKAVELARRKGEGVPAWRAMPIGDDVS